MAFKWKNDNENNGKENITRIKSAELDPMLTRTGTGTITLEITRTKKAPVKGSTLGKLLKLKGNH